MFMNMIVINYLDISMRKHDTMMIRSVCTLRI